MNVLSILGSPRMRGNSTTIARAVTSLLEQEGAVIREYVLNKMSFRGCQGCYQCKSGHKECVLTDDLTPVLAGMHTADVLVIASPVYYSDLTGQFKLFMDRTHGLLRDDFMTNPHPSRLPEGKKLVCVVTQGVADPNEYDVLDRYDFYFKMYGFTTRHTIHGCGLQHDSSHDALAPYLAQAREVAEALLAQE